MARTKKIDAMPILMALMTLRGRTAEETFAPGDLVPPGLFDEDEIAGKIAAGALRIARDEEIEAARLAKLDAADREAAARTAEIVAARRRLFALDPALQAVFDGDESVWLAESAKLDAAFEEWAAHPEGQAAKAPFRGWMPPKKD